jgi:hypothetical protein
MRSTVTVSRCKAGIQQVSGIMKTCIMCTPGFWRSKLQLYHTEARLRLLQWRLVPTPVSIWFRLRVDLIASPQIS